MLTQTAKSVRDQHKAEEAEKHGVELLESREDSPIALRAPEQPLDFIAPPVHGPVVFPRVKTCPRWRNDRNETQVQGQLTCLVSFVRAVHEQVDWAIRWAQALKEAATFRGIMSLSRRQTERHGRSSIRGNQMNLGVPSASGLSDGLRAVFFNAPVPSG